MFVTNVIVGTIFLTTVFDDIRHAWYAIQSREKVWTLITEPCITETWNLAYELESLESADYKDEHILSFFGSI